MANPNPTQNEKFKQWQQRGKSDRPLAASPLSVRFYADVDAVLRDMGDRQSYVRSAVEEKMQADGLLSLDSKLHQSPETPAPLNAPSPSEKTQCADEPESQTQVD